MPRSCTGAHAERDIPPFADPTWNDALRAAVQVACHRALTDPGPCSLAALCLALRRLHDNIRTLPVEQPMRKPSPFPTRRPPTRPRTTPRTVSSDSLLQSARELPITHRGQRYRLLETRAGRRLLTG